MQADVLRGILLHDEDERTEFKLTYQTQDRIQKQKLIDEMAKDIVALANAAGRSPDDYAYLIIGAGDKKDSNGGRLTQDVRQKGYSARTFLDIVNSRCYPPLQLTYEIVDVDGHSYGVVTIKPSPYVHALTRNLDTPRGFWPKNSVLTRIGDEIQVASPQESLKIELEKGKWGRITAPSFFISASEEFHAAIGRNFLFLLPILAVYSWLFKVWDRSDFPDETFTHPLYWFGVGLIFALAIVCGFFVRNKKSTLDSLIITALCAGGIATFVISGLVAREATFSDKLYSVAVFKFRYPDEDSETASVAARFRANIVGGLEKLTGELNVVERAREIKGDMPDERAMYVRKWAHRKRGSHLAIWARIDKEEKLYKATIYFVKVHTFGREERVDIIGHFSDWSLELNSIQSFGPNEVNEVVKNVRFYCGLAGYLKGDDDSAIAVLSKLNGSNAHYYAGQALYYKARRSRTPHEMLQQSASQLETAIRSYAGNDRVKAMYYLALAMTYTSQVASQVTTAPLLTIDTAISNYLNAVEILRTLRLAKTAAVVEAEEARAYYERHLLNSEEITDLKRSEDLLEKALPNLGIGTGYRAQALVLLGIVYAAKARRADSESSAEIYENAIASEKEAVTFFEKANDASNLVDALRSLGLAQSDYGIFLADNGRRSESENQYRDGRASLARATELCESQCIFTCYLAHDDIGQEAFGWARLWRETSSDWSTSLEDGVRELKAAKSFVSKDQQPGLYRDAARNLALIYVERGLGEKGDVRLRFLQLALEELTETIGIVGDSTDPAKLYAARARCYHLLAGYSNDRAQRTEYAKLARLDEASASKPHWQIVHPQ